MWIVAIVCVAGFVLWQSNKRRAKRFVRSVFFLELTDSGVSPDGANGQVARLFTKQSSADEDNAAIRYAMDKADRLQGESNFRGYMKPVRRALPSTAVIADLTWRILRNRGHIRTLISNFQNIFPKGDTH